MLWPTEIRSLDLNKFSSIQFALSEESVLQKDKNYMEKIKQGREIQSSMDFNFRSGSHRQFHCRDNVLKKGLKEMRKISQNSRGKYLPD